VGAPVSHPATAVQIPSAMYIRCVSCARDLGRNAEVPGFAVGRRLAFDRGTGRLWVICPHCEEWNLALLETRWEAVEACELLVGEAEARVTGGAMGFARTRGGLQLLRVGGFGRDDIANWRYGRIIARRRQWALVAMGLVAASVAALSIWAALVSRSEAVGVWCVGVLGYSAWWQYQRAPGAVILGRTSGGRRFLAWGVRLEGVSLHAEALHDESHDAPHGGPELRVPGLWRDAVYRGRDALEVLARLLARRSWSALGDADVRDAVEQVDRAERPEPQEQSESRPARSSRRRRKQRGTRGPIPAAPIAPAPLPPAPPAWHRIARDARGGLVMRNLSISEQLALEMAIREEIERRDMQREAAASRADWTAADEVGRISDDLLLPERIWAWLRTRARGR